MPTRQPAEFLQLMGASLALAGVERLHASSPAEKIVPYVETPEQIVPGKPLYFATAFASAGYASGVLVESHMGRPTKIEGNPEHPASLGSDRPLHPGGCADALRPRPLAGGDADGRIGTWEPSALAARRSASVRAKKGGRAADLDRDGHFAHAGRPAAAAERAVPRGEMAQYEPIDPRSVRAGAGWPSARTSSRSITSTRPT